MRELDVLLNKVHTHASGVAGTWVSPHINSHRTNERKAGQHNGGQRDLHYEGREKGKIIFVRVTSVFSCKAVTKCTPSEV